MTHSSVATRHGRARTGFNLIGYFTAVRGVGEVARQVLTALDAVGFPAVPIGLVTGYKAEQPAPRALVDEAIFPVNLVCANADVMPELDARGLLRGRYSIGWWWEAHRPTDHVTESFAMLDEVWAGSTFAADAVRALAPVPVRTATLPIELPAGITADRAGFGFASRRIR